MIYAHQLKENTLPRTRAQISDLADILWPQNEFIPAIDRLPLITAGAVSGSFQSQRVVRAAGSLEILLVVQGARSRRS